MQEVLDHLEDSMTAQDWFDLITYITLVVVFILVFIHCVKWYKREVIDVVEREQQDRIDFDCEALKK